MATKTIPAHAHRGTQSAPGYDLRISGSEEVAVVGGLLYAQTAPSAAVANTTTETVFTEGVYSVPASLLTLGRSLRVTFQGIATATNGTDTLAIKLIIGGTATNTTGTTLILLPALDVANNDTFSGEFILTARAAPGATAACVGRGFYVFGADGTATVKGAMLASTNLATNAALPVKVSAAWSVANAGNSCRMDAFTVELV